MRKFIFLTTLCLFVFYGVASAEAFVSKTHNEQTCKMEGTGNVTINIKNLHTDLGNIKTLFEGKVEEIKALAKAKGFSGLELKSMNYNANSNSYGGCNQKQQPYNINGNIGFSITPADQAADLTALLVENGYNANFNVSMYRKCQ